jgi:hypothetical protein
MKNIRFRVLKTLIFIVTSLLLTNVISISIPQEYNSSDNFINSQEPPPSWLKGSDQTQTNSIGNGFCLFTDHTYAQGFRPSKEILTAVALWLFDYYASSGTIITVSIRDNLSGDNLAIKTIKTNIFNIKGSGSWVLFDFEDITVIPSEEYYILCWANNGYENHTYNWFFDIDNRYSKGAAWFSNDTRETWNDLEEPTEIEPLKYIDFCFITYHQEPKTKPHFNPFLRFLENHPRLFPILRLLLT